MLTDMCLVSGNRIFVAMKRLGKPCWMLNYTGEPHWPTKIANKIDFQKRMFQFFNHYLKKKQCLNGCLTGFRL